MPRTNASNVEVAARVDEILALRLDGLQFHDLRALAVQKGWGVRERTLWSYLKRTDMLIASTTRRTATPFSAATWPNVERSTPAASTPPTTPRL